MSTWQGNLLPKGLAIAPRARPRGAIDESTRTVVSSDGWKLSLRDKDLNELYNLSDDPLETCNLCSNGEYASVISRYTDEIHKWQESTHDKLKI